MTTKPSITSRARSIIGFVGVVLCVAATLGVWYTQIKLSGAVKDLFAAADSQLDSVDQRLGDVAVRLDWSKQSAEELRNQLKQWAEHGVRDRLNERSDRQHWVAILEGTFRNVDPLLESTGNTIESFLQTLELAAKSGLPIEAEALHRSLDAFTTEIKSVRTATQTIHEKLVAIDGDLWAMDRGSLLKRRGEREQPEEVELSGEDRGQLLQLLAQLTATFGRVDERLADCRTGLDELQAKLVGWESGVRWRITIVAVIATLLFVWMGAGQYALWRRANS